MCESSEYGSDSDCGDSEDVTDLFRGSFACLSKVKSKTPRARFDIHFYPKFIRLIQYGQQEISNKYKIRKDNVIETFRLSYSNDTQSFFVLHLKRPIIGGNRSTTEYSFVVFNFTREEYEEVTLHLDNPAVRDMFDEDTVAGPTVDVFETIVAKIFAKEATTPAVNYDGNKAARALRCTFWDNDEHFLYPLDDGFVNVWKYCQRLHLRDIKNVKFVCSQGRYKTFDFYIYPIMKRAIRRYHIGSGKSNTIDCFYLEFKAIDLDQYDGLFEYCNRNRITISTKNFQCDTDSSSKSGSQETSASDSDSSDLIDDGFEAPDPYLAHLRDEKQSSSDSSSNSTNVESGSASEEEVSKENAENTTDPLRSIDRKRRFRRIQIANENESSSSDSVAAGSRKRRSRRLDSDDDTEQNSKVVVKTDSLIDDDSD